MDLSQLDELKSKLVGADDFGDPWNFFFDNFGESPEFMALGEPMESDLLETVLGRIAGEVFEGTPSTTPPMLVSLKEHHFIHGSCFMEGRLAVIIFFSDIDMGMLSILRSDSSAMLIRFSSYQIEKDKAINLHPGSSTTVQ